MEKIIFLVGRNFLDFTVHSAVMSVDDFLKQYKNLTWSEDISFILGQGISNAEMQKIEEVLSDIGASVKLYIREDKKFVHKLKDENVMITKPARITDNSFSAFLTLDKRCAEMSDHVSGQHIQGMVIIEAARQMMLAVTENYLIEKGDQGNIWVILNDVQVKFFALLFPLEVRINCIIRDSEKNNASGHYMAIVSFSQNGKKTSDVNIMFSIYPKEKLAHGERLLAEKSIKLMMKKKI